MTTEKWKDAFPIDIMQCMRLEEHPMHADGNIIVIDNLENGTLKLYEYIGGPLHMQSLLLGKCDSKNAVLIAEAVISALWREEGVFIHKIHCEDGYEHLVQPMIYQILHFADFYKNYQSVGILDREYEHWYPYAKEALTDFQKINRVYELCLPDGGLDG